MPLDPALMLNTGMIGPESMSAGPCHDRRPFVRVAEAERDFAELLPGALILIAGEILIH